MSYICLFPERQSHCLPRSLPSKSRLSWISPIYGQPDLLKAILEILLTYAKSNPNTVIMDEFQDIQKVNASFFSDMQNLWDSHRLDARMHLICCGSLYSMMTHLFQNSKQPLFGRADHRINLQPLQVELLAQPVLRFTNTGGF